MAQALDFQLKGRLREVLAGQPVTEAELRKLADEGRVWTLILGGRLEQDQQRLSELASDPASSLTEYASVLRRVNELRPDLDELKALLADLQARAREFRASWLATS